jgi:hypothetical protein
MSRRTEKKKTATKLPVAAGEPISEHNVCT